MSRTVATARFAAVLALAVVLFTAGLVSGAAGDPLILGSQTNNSGSAGTKVSSSVNGNAFAISQTGVGASANGIRGDANTGTGGVFTSSSNNALFATAASGNRFAMVAVSNGGAGTGGSLLALGNANPALDIQTNSGVPPMTVNQSALVANLNADRLDGRHALDFYEYGDDVPGLQTLTGFWVVSEEAAAAGDDARGAISFPVPMPSELTPHVIEPGASLPTGCSGSVTNPGASGGNLCIFVNNEVNVASYGVFDHDGILGTSPFGAYIRATSSAIGTSLAAGTWAATAPLIIILSESGEPSGPRDGHE